MKYNNISLNLTFLLNYETLLFLLLLLSSYNYKSMERYFRKMTVTINKKVTILTFFYNKKMKHIINFVI